MNKIQDARGRALELAELLDRYRMARRALENVLSINEADPLGPINEADPFGQVVATVRFDRARERIESRLAQLDNSDAPGAKVLVHLAFANVHAVRDFDTDHPDQRIAEALKIASEIMHTEQDTFLPNVDLQIAVDARRRRQVAAAIDAIDRAVDRPRGSGLEHMAAELYREVVVLGIAAPDDSRVVSLTKRTAAIPKHTFEEGYNTRAQIHEAHAIKAVADERIDDAIGELAKAIQIARDERLRDDTTIWSIREQTIEELALRHSSGWLHEQIDLYPNALAEYMEAIRLAEKVRVGWQVANNESDPFWLLFKRVFHSAILAAAKYGNRAVDDAFEIIEISKRSGLAGSLLLNPKVLDSIGHDLAERIVVLGEISGSDASVIRDQLRESISDVFADLVLPNTPDFPAVLAQLEHPGLHVLDYLVTSDPGKPLSGVVVWINQGKPLSLTSFELDKSEMHWLTIDHLRAVPVEKLHTLGQRLIPPNLADLLTNMKPDADVRVIVSPDGMLTQVPWSALVVNETSCHLVERCVLTLSPAISLLKPSGNSDHLSTHSVLPVIPSIGATTGSDSLPVSKKEEEIGQTFSKWNRSSLAEQLITRNWSSVYLYAHGSGEGLEQRFYLDDEVECDATWALTVPWPRSVVMISCWVGAPSLSANRQPMGLVVSCLARGAEQIVGAVSEFVPDELVRSDLLLALQTDTDLGRALTASQRRFLKDRRKQSPRLDSTRGLGVTEWAVPVVYSVVLPSFA